VVKLNEAKDALQPTNSAGTVLIASPPPPASSAYQAAIVGSPASPAKVLPTPPQLVVPPSPKIVAFNEPSSPVQTNTNKRNSRAITVSSSDSEPDEPTKTPVTVNPKDAGKVIMSGYLMKCGSKRKTWRKRWFVLSAERMIYTGSHMVRNTPGSCQTWMGCVSGAHMDRSTKARLMATQLIVLSAVWAEVRCGIWHLVNRVPCPESSYG